MQFLMILPYMPLICGDILVPCSAVSPSHIMAYVCCFFSLIMPVIRCYMPLFAFLSCLYVFYVVYILSFIWVRVR